MTLYQNTHYIQNTKQEYVPTPILLTSTNMTMIYKLTTACLHNCSDYFVLFVHLHLYLFSRVRVDNYCL